MQRRWVLLGMLGVGCLLNPQPDLPGPQPDLPSQPTGPSAGEDNGDAGAGGSGAADDGEAAGAGGAGE